MSDTHEKRSLEAPDLSDLDVEQAVLRLIQYAARLPASDLFFLANENDAAICVRHLGIVRPLMSVTRDELARYINHTKAIAGMAVDQRLRPLDGRCICEIEGGHRVDVRINTIPTLWGEDMAVRLLAHDMALLDLGNLGFHAQNLDHLLV